MYKYSAKALFNRALSLADLQNSNFITWGDAFQMLNSAYRKIYQDSINVGDLNYIKEVRLLTYGTAAYELPEDFYQVAMVTDDYGNEIPLLGLASSISDYGYSIKNGIIKLQNVQSNVILKYYPTPDTITFKKDTKNTWTWNYLPVSGFGSNCYLANGQIIGLNGTAYSQNNVASQNIILGEGCYLDVSNRNLYYINNLSPIDVLVRPMLTPNGTFIENEFDTALPACHGWCNNDASARYMVSEGYVYFNGNKIGTVADLMKNNVVNGRVIYWNCQWALVTLSKIVYPDGTWETTDSPRAMALLKCDTETGYGYVVRTGSSTFSVEGWTPDTNIDYPNNILFDLTAYDLAIQFRIKQSADASGLQAAYQQLEKTYYKSISNDNDNFVTIRNVNKRYTKWRMF